ncbi:hypothetical protein CAF53_14395 [Sphingobium sp. LB126]|uniref:hypothetical protein n=1 Tax=Sphingobium sp. LB126 TaxID=1983755 RepID=UPI000C20718F|nr:hypothetical protein [Sphingobium sp. LB126]PJG49277.1 hypothetical protein CAF53_14395 [Sphingobium sp. LB126]
MEQRPLIERLARHLAAGDSDSWQDHVEDAASLLALLKSPDDTMREVGNARIWDAMIDAVLRERWAVAPGSQAGEPPAGTDEEGEIALPPDSVGGNHADWVHLHRSEEKPK